MTNLFALKRRDHIAKGLLRVFSLGGAGLLVSDSIWKAGLKAKVVVGIILLATFLVSWFVCPTKGVKNEDE